MLNPIAASCQYLAKVVKINDIMEITHLGHASFKIRGKNVTLVTDPFNPQMLGIKFPSVTADVVTISHDHEDHNFKGQLEGEPIIFSAPGEYEVKGAKIIGIPTFHDNSKGTERGKNTVYRMTVDGVTIVHCGDLGHKFDDIQLETLEGANILMLPVGGFYTIDAATASEVVSQVNPSIIIPMHYNTPSLDQKVFSKLAGVEVFLKQMGKEGIFPQQKLVITKDKLPVEPMVVVLE